ncbi:MAG: SufB/SufD family protein [Muribaculaceae bacterium]
MSSLNQYLQFFEANRAAIDSHAPEAMNCRRDAALATLRRLGRFPRRGDEGYEVVSLEDMYAPDYGINIARVSFGEGGKSGVHGCDIPNVGTISASVVNDTFVEDYQRALPEGVELMSLARAAELYPDCLSRSVAPADNAVVALNDLLLQDGVYIRVHRGVSLPKPIQILSLFNASMPLMGVRRIVIDVEDNASAIVIACDHPRTTEVDYLACRVVDIRLGRGASLDFNDLEEATARCSRSSVIAAVQGADSDLHISSITLDGGVTRNEYYVSHLGDGCHTSVNGIVVAGGTQVVDNASYVVHDHEHCTSDQLFKYALFDSAQGGFEGLVNVRHGARFTDAAQSNRNLLVSPQARMHAMPQLVIDCDDVKASHGSATGQLNADALFYMQSRGIPADEARMILINAFMAEGLDKIKHEPLRSTLLMLLDRRLRGCSDSCAACHGHH